MHHEDPFAPLRDERPAAALRDRVRDELRGRGLLRAPRHWSRHPGLLAAAAALLFLAGLWTGARDDATPSAPQFALLLYEPAGFDTTRSHAELAREYGAWAASLGAMFVGGEALGAERIVTPDGRPAPSAGDRPTGYFLLRADSWDAALALAAACPHVRHGGTIAVREILTG